MPVDPSMVKPKVLDKIYPAAAQTAKKEVAFMKPAEFAKKIKAIAQKEAIENFDGSAIGDKLAEKLADKYADDVMREIEQGPWYKRAGVFAEKQIAKPGNMARSAGKKALMAGAVLAGVAFVANKLSGRAERDRNDAALDAEREALEIQREELANDMRVLSAEESMGAPNTMMGMQPQPGEFANRVRGGAGQDMAIPPQMSAADFDEAGQGFADRTKSDGSQMGMTT